MGFLRRLIGPSPAVPEWASFFTADEYQAFLEVVRRDLGRRGQAFEIGDGVARVAGSDAEWGLTNLAQLCHASDRNDWETIVAAHFSNLSAIQGRDLDALAADFEQVRPILRVRLFADESMDGLSVDDVAVARRLAPGILLAMVYDFPDSTQSVASEHVASWPLPEVEVWEIATDNVALEPNPIRESIAADKGSFELELGDSFYVASRSLRLADHLPAGTMDAVFAVPTRNSHLFHAIKDVSVIPTMQAMLQLTLRLFEGGPGSISNQLYWWHEGAITHLPVQMRGRSVDFFPPDDFVAFLNTLGESDGS